MTKEYGPKPLVEEHYHISHLIDQQDKRVQERNYHREKSKDREERAKTLADSKLVAITDFLCNKCGEEFKSMSIREIEDDWSCYGQQIAFYKAKCSKGHWCIRWITDRLYDPYWMRSQQVALDRGRHHNDILQPFETGYNLLFGKK